MGHQTVQLLTEDANGRLIPFQTGTSITTPLDSLEVQGNGIAAGTLLLAITVPAGSSVNIMGHIFQSLTMGALRCNIVHSNLAVVGGVETVIGIYDSPMGADDAHDGFEYTYNNTTAATRYLLFYLPANRIGLAGNNAVGIYAHLRVYAQMA